MQLHDFLSGVPAIPCLCCSFSDHISGHVRPIETPTSSSNVNWIFQFSQRHDISIFLFFPARHLRVLFIAPSSLRFPLWPSISSNTNEISHRICSTSSTIPKTTSREFFASLSEILSTWGYQFESNRIFYENFGITTEYTSRVDVRTDNRVPREPPGILEIGSLSDDESAGFSRNEIRRQKADRGWISDSDPRNSIKFYSSLFPLLIPAFHRPLCFRGTH